MTNKALGCADLVLDLLFSSSCNMETANSYLQQFIQLSTSAG